MKYCSEHSCGKNIQSKETEIFSVGNFMFSTPTAQQRSTQRGSCLKASLVVQMQVDCEGCFDPILREFPSIIDNVKRIFLEADYGKGWQRMGFADYAWIHDVLTMDGFNMVTEGARPHSYYSEI